MFVLHIGTNIKTVWLTGFRLYTRKAHSCLTQFLESRCLHRVLLSVRAFTVSTKHNCHHRTYHIHNFSRCSCLQRPQKHGVPNRLASMAVVLVELVMPTSVANKTGWLWTVAARLLVDVCVHNGGQESGSVYNRNSCSLKVFWVIAQRKYMYCVIIVYTFNSFVLLASTCTKMVGL